MDIAPPNPSRPTVAIVGAGLMGRWHAHYAHRAGARVAAVVDLDRERAQTLAQRFKAEAVNLPAALNQADAAHVCLPYGPHREVVLQSLDAGLHVLVEKPLAKSTAEADEFYAAAERARRTLCPVHQFPFQRGFGSLKTKQSQLGKPQRLRFEIRSAGGDGMTRDERRRLLAEILPHPLSVVAALRGPAALQADWRVDRFDSDLLAVRADDGTSLAIEIDLASRPTANHLVYSAEGGTAHVDFFHGYARFETGEPSRRDKALRPFKSGLSEISGAAANLLGRVVRREPAYPGLPELISAFYDACAGKSSVPIPPAEVVAISALIEKISPPG